MVMKIITWGPVVGLLLAAMSWHAQGNYAALLDLAVCAGVIVITKQAIRAREYPWAFGFVGMALLLNPIAPVLTPAGNLLLLLLLVCASPFILAFGALMDATITLYPNLITDLHPRGEPIRPSSGPVWAHEAH